MRLYSFVAAAALLSASLAAHADTLSQSFAVPFLSNDGNNFSSYEGSYPSYFDPALGTINSVSLSASGTVTIAGSPPFNDTSIFIVGTSANKSFTAAVRTNNGTFNLSEAFTSTDPFVLSSAQNRSTSGSDIEFDGQFISSANVIGTITYNYTPTAAPPAAVTPEPSSIALLGTGVLGVAGVVRKRFA